MTTVKEFVELMKQTALSDCTEAQLELKAKVFQTWAGTSKDEAVRYLHNTDSKQTKIFQSGLLWLYQNGYGDMSVDEATGRGVK